MSVDPTQRTGSQEQFGRQAHFYTESLVHSSGESLQVVQDWVARGTYRRAADIGTGTGFTAFTAAPYSDRVLATDITVPMLRETRSLATRRGLHNVEYVRAAAEALPFARGSLDLLTCRTAAHHFQDIPQAVAQWQMALAPEAVLVLADTTSPEDPDLAAWMNDIELRRDPSHMRDWSPSEWLALIEDNGFQVTDTALTAVPMMFNEWVKRSGIPTEVIEGLRRDFLNATAGAVEEFHILPDDTGPDGNGDIGFQWTCLVVRALRKV